MALDTMIEKLMSAKKAYEDQLKELGETAAQEVAKYLCANIPEGFCLEWTQYTPWFNDGDTCTFGVNDAYLYKIEYDEFGKETYERNAEERDNSFGLGSYYVNKYGVEKWTLWNGEERPGEPEIDGLPRATLVALSEAWKKIPEDMFHQAFGDHTKVKVYSDGKFENDSYDHD